MESTKKLSLGAKAANDPTIIKTNNIDDPERVRNRNRLVFSDAEKIRLLTQLSSYLDAGGTSITSFFETRLQEVQARADKADPREFWLGGEPGSGLFVAEMANMLSQGLAFYAALARFPNIFPERTVTLIKTGELSGRLTSSRDKKSGENKAGILELHAGQIQEISEVKSKFKQKMITPAFFFIVVGFVLYLAFNHIIPSFATLYESLLGGINQLNPITRSLVIVGEFFRDWFFFVFIFVVVALTSYLILRKKTETLKEMEGWLLMRIPLVNRYVLFSNVYSWLTTLLLLLDAGSKDPVETVREASKTVENRELRNACFRAVEFMETKAFPDIQDAMAEAHPCFGRSSVLFRVLKQYFTKTGNVKEIDQFAEEVRKKMRAQQETLLNLVEPVVLCICAPITLWIVLGLYLPLFELIGKFGAK